MGQGIIGLDILSAGEEAAWLGHLVSEFALGAQVPRQGCDADDDGAEDGGVCLPVGGLSVPAAGWRPDVLGIPGILAG